MVMNGSYDVHNDIKLRNLMEQIHNWTQIRLANLFKKYWQKKEEEEVELLCMW